MFLHVSENITKNNVDYLRCNNIFRHTCNHFLTKEHRNLEPVLTSSAEQREDHLRNRSKCNAVRMGVMPWFPPRFTFGEKLDAASNYSTSDSVREGENKAIEIEIEKTDIEKTERKEVGAETHKNREKDDKIELNKLILALKYGFDLVDQKPYFVQWFKNRKNQITVEEMWENLQCSECVLRSKKYQESRKFCSDSQMEKEEKIVEELERIENTKQSEIKKTTREEEDDTMGVGLDEVLDKTLENIRQIIVKWYLIIILHSVMLRAISLGDLCQYANLKWYTVEELYEQLELIAPFISEFLLPLLPEAPQERKYVFKKILDGIMQNYTASRNFRKFTNGCKINSFWNDLLN
ncbi:hypothetical protein TNCT_323181 [Trichonephila clavata]|uniref:Uncharacterized protein n=1 Tax=Trichonephila clavata TaxID=2740835 RepID=A0A8X6GUT6_TRICU|nr:hypothetical protein TNCT_323181 [Trichonephila clavata]